MSSIFRLNDYNVRENPFAGSHDPSMMFDPVTGRYYSYCTDTFGPAIGVADRIGIPVRSSPDLVHFTYHGSVLYLFLFFYFLYDNRTFNSGIHHDLTKWFFNRTFDNINSSLFVIIISFD